MNIREASDLVKYTFSQRKQHFLHHLSLNFRIRIQKINFSVFIRKDKVIPKLNGSQRFSQQNADTLHYTKQKYTVRSTSIGCKHCISGISFNLSETSILI